MDNCAALDPATRSSGQELTLRPEEVVVHSLRLDLPENALARCRAVLEAHELRRAERFHNETLRSRWTAAHGQLRLLLSRYLDCRPEDLRFDQGRFGKPALAGDFACCGLEFNLSHSEEVGLLAVTQGRAVGVDVERIRVLDDFDELVQRFFSRREARLFRELSGTAKPAAFFNLWTRKEAWLKATGEGIGQFLNQVEVSFLPGENVELIRLPRWLLPNASWTLRALHPFNGYAAALAVQGDDFQLKHWSADIPVRPSSSLGQERRGEVDVS